MSWAALFWVLTVVYFNVVLHFIYRQFRSAMKDRELLRSHTFHLKLALSFLSFIAWAAFYALYIA